MGELLFKILVTLVLLWLIGWLWTQHVDPLATLVRVARSVVPLDLVATRDASKLYRDGEPAADIVGQVEELDGRVVFHELENASKLRTGQLVEYKRKKLRVVSIERRTIQLVSPRGTRHNVLENVVCEVVD